MDGKSARGSRLSRRREWHARVALLLWLIPCTFLVLAGSACRPFERVATLRGDYLGQDPPGPVPALFAPGVVSHGFHELSAAFAPDGNELFYVMSDRRGNYTIVRIARGDDGWSDPEIAPFSGRYPDASPCFSADGRVLYFCSRRPVSGAGPPRADFDIWMVRREDDTWSAPSRLDPPLNDDMNVLDVTVSRGATIYFSADHNDARAANLYVSRPAGEAYSAPEALGGEINTDFIESGAWVDPDERYLLFQSRRPGGLGGNDLYVSFRDAKGLWGQPINLGERVNSAFNDYRPRVSPEGKYLFFSSGRPVETGVEKAATYGELLESYRHPQSGYGTLFWISASVIDEARSVE